jgi:hypothetical protein
MGRLQTEPTPRMPSVDRQDTLGMSRDTLTFQVCLIRNTYIVSRLGFHDVGEFSLCKLISFSSHPLPDGAAASVCC